MGKAGKDSSVHRSDDCGRAGEQTENANGQGRAVTTAERAWADAPRERIEALQEQLAAHQEGVDATETIRQAEAMVDNLREAHAGEVSALKTERHRLATQIDGFAVRADQAEARTDSLRARVDVLQRERDTARAAAQEAVDGLRQAEEERRARGLLARLRAAWRGR
jgi:chromosome segregation ATPase